MKEKIKKILNTIICFIFLFELFFTIAIGFMACAMADNGYHIKAITLLIVHMCILVVSGIIFEKIDIYE